MLKAKRVRMTNIYTSKTKKEGKDQLTGWAKDPEEKDLQGTCTRSQLAGVCDVHQKVSKAHAHYLQDF